MFLRMRKSRFFLMLLFLVAAVVGCAEPDVETQLIEQNAEEKVSLPPEVEQAMQEGIIDEIEVPVALSEGDLSKPSAFSKIYMIDYIDRSESVHEAPSPPEDNTTCGKSSVYSVRKFKWTSFPVPYSISTKSLPVEIDPSAAKAAIINAFNTWDAEERPVGNLFVEAKEGETPKLTVRWGSIDGKSKVLAFTENTFNNATKIIISSRLMFDTGDLWKVFPSLNCKSQGSEFDIESVAAHEVGHAIGLLHPPNTRKNKSLTLYAFGSPGETLKRTLDKGDKFGAARLYPAKKK